jgi:hypothetical protein
LLSPAPPHHDAGQPSFSSSVSCALPFVLLPFLNTIYSVIDLLQAIRYTGSWLWERQTRIAADSIQGNNR